VVGDRGELPWRYVHGVYAIENRQFKSSSDRRGESVGGGGEGKGGQAKGGNGPNEADSMADRVGKKGGWGNRAPAYEGQKKKKASDPK